MLKANNYKLILIPFITICCCLYQMVYLGSFHLNGLSLISFESMIRSSIEPLLFTIIGATAGLFFGAKIYDKTPIAKALKTDNSETEEGSFSLSKLIVAVILFIACYGLMIAISFIFYKNKMFPYAFILASLAGIFLDENFVFDPLFITKFSKTFLILLLLHYPLLSIAIAIDDANEIIDNKHYNFVVFPNKTKPSIEDTLKLITRIDNTYVMTDFKNSKNIFLKSDSIVIFRR
jgi:hypothetical protein